MTQQEAKQLFEQIENLFEKYIPGAWSISEKDFDRKTVIITIEYDYYKIDWDLVDESWEKRADKELGKLCNQWGALFDWHGPVVEIKLEDHTI